MAKKSEKVVDLSAAAADVYALPLHPDAADFPMMSDTELVSLAASIRERGLIHPITIGVFDRAGQVVEMVLDGRNRLAACRLAEVEPTVRRVTGSAAADLALDLNTKRRSLTKSQLAIVAARAWARAEAEGRVVGKGESSKLSGSDNLIRAPRDHFAALYGVGRDLVVAARDVLAVLPDEADAVARGTLKLTEAVERANKKRKDDKAAEDKRTATEKQWAEFLADAPDLAVLVDEDRMGRAEALGAWQARVKEAERRLAENKAHAKRVAESLDAAAVVFAPGTEGDPKRHAVVIADDLRLINWAPAQWSSADSIRKMGELFLALADDLEGGNARQREVDNGE